MRRHRGVEAVAQSHSRRRPVSSLVNSDWVLAAIADNVARLLRRGIDRDLAVDQCRLDAAVLVLLVEPFARLGGQRRGVRRALRRDRPWRRPTASQYRTSTPSCRRRCPWLLLLEDPVACGVVSRRRTRYCRGGIVADGGGHAGILMPGSDERSHAEQNMVNGWLTEKTGPPRGAAARLSSLLRGEQFDVEHQNGGRAE